MLMRVQQLTMCKSRIAKIDTDSVEALTLCFVNSHSKSESCRELEMLVVEKKFRINRNQFLKEWGQVILMVDALPRHICESE